MAASQRSRGTEIRRSGLPFPHDSGRSLAGKRVEDDRQIDVSSVAEPGGDTLEGADALRVEPYRIRGDLLVGVATRGCVADGRSGSGSRAAGESGADARGQEGRYELVERDMLVVGECR
jgi:hypothetical protein